MHEQDDTSPGLPRLPTNFVFSIGREAAHTFFHTLSMEKLVRVHNSACLIYSRTPDHPRNSPPKAKARWRTSRGYHAGGGGPFGLVGACTRFQQGCAAAWLFLPQSVRAGPKFLAISVVLPRPRHAPNTVTLMSVWLHNVVAEC